MLIFFKLNVTSLFFVRFKTGMEIDCAHAILQIIVHNTSMDHHVGWDLWTKLKSKQETESSGCLEIQKQFLMLPAKCLLREDRNRVDGEMIKREITWNVCTLQKYVENTLLGGGDCG